MGVLPLQFQEGTSAQTLGLDGSETFSLLGLTGELTPRQQVMLKVRRQDGREEEVPLTLRIDTPIEVEYYRHGGILPYVLREILQRLDRGPKSQNIVELRSIQLQRLRGRALLELQGQHAHADQV